MHMSDMASQSLATGMFVQHLFRLTTKETSKLHITGPLSGESTGDQWIPLTKGK